MGIFEMKNPPLCRNLFEVPLLESLVRQPMEERKAPNVYMPEFDPPPEVRIVPPNHQIIIIIIIRMRTIDQDTQNGAIVCERKISSRMWEELCTSD